MELNIKKAFLSPFSDEKWYIKLIFPAAVAFLGLFFNLAVLQQNNHKAAIIMLIVLLPGIVCGGFFLQFAHNEIHDKLPLLPNLKFKLKEYLAYGVKLLSLFLLYSIVLSFIIGGIFFTFNIIFGIILGLFSVIFHISNTIMAIIACIIFGVIYIPMAIFMFIYLLLITGAFAYNFNFKEALDCKKILRMLPKVKSEMIIYILLEICFFIVLFIMMILLSLSNITLIVTPIAIVIMTVIQFSSMNLKAQIYKIAKFRLEEQV